MPAIRDYRWNYHSSTSGTSITIEVPSYQEGDLLLAVLSADSGTQTWSCSGWTVLFSQTNSCNLAVAYKIASGNEPASYTFTYSTSETANGSIISIMDVDRDNPIANHNRANFTAARQAMPQTTTTRDNSLLIFIATHGSTAVIPSIIEGPVTQLYSADGAAHADAVAWGFQVRAGTTPGNVYVTVSGTTYNGVLATLVINPPSSGAQVIPTYCAEDRSIYVDPIHGTTAFRGNTAFSNAVTTYWTSPLAGRTLSSATVSAKTDYGINPFRSCGGMTGPTTADTYQGAVLVLADTNRVDIRGKNVLVHAMPLTPADIQTVYDAGSGKGIEFGIASSANNGVVWHVHGANTPFGINRVPIVVNTLNTSGIIDSRGNPDFSLAKVFGFFTCGFLVSSDWVWTMIWVLDTTVICGGNSSNPVSLESIVNVTSLGHERISALIQGKSEAMFLQPIQIGNGGADPVYLLLDATCIEFPEIYNVQKRMTFYCSAPNVAGITYYAGSGDTIIHRNSFIISASPYHWRIHPSSSPSATYDFSGLTLVGAGDIQLHPQIPINQMSFIKCAPITIPGCTITNCTFSYAGSQGAIVIDDANKFNGKVSDCSFYNNQVAIKITTPGTYVFNNLKFEGNTYDIENASTGTVTIYLNNSNASSAKVLNSNGGGTNPISSATHRLTGVKPGSEVTYVDTSSGEVVFHVEEVDSSGVTEYVYDTSTVRTVDILVFHPDYLPVTIPNVTLDSNGGQIPIVQVWDRVKIRH